VKKFTKLLVLFVLASTAMAGCTKQEEKKAPTPQTQGAKKETIVVVPDSVKGKWKAVRIAVNDKIAKKESVHTINIGSELAIPGSDLVIKVENFLPQFVMEGTTLTSQSNEPKNPAAQIRINQGGKEIFKGWLFSLYPTTHALQHPQYSFTLVDFIPAS
jgi:hypothetical protein